MKKAKKIFEAEYGNHLADKVSEWIEKQTLTKERGCKVYRPYAVVELFDQNGEELNENVSEKT